MKTNLLLIFGVIIILFLVLTFCTNLLVPSWGATGTSMKRIYEEPRNRVQTLFIGTSRVVNAISPITLYNDYGMCAYNLSTPQQPLFSSYYWLREMKRLHPDTLTTVVIDPSAVFADNEDAVAAANEKTFTNMPLTPLKFRMLEDYAAHHEDFHMIDYIFPLIAYHSRWSELDKDDFSSMSGEEPFYYTRGLHVFFTMASKTEDPSAIPVPDHTITAEQDRTDAENQAFWINYDLEYLDKIAAFCKEEQMNLVFIKIAQPISDTIHDALQYLTDRYEVPFIDFNMPELMEATDQNYAQDYMDIWHPNIYGTAKITEYVGKYLKDNYEIADIREDPKYAYMAEQAEMYTVVDGSAALRYYDQLTEYLRALNKDRFTLYVSVEEGAAGLTEEHLQLLEDLGFSELRYAGEGCAYIGVSDKGKRIADHAAASPDETVVMQGTIDLQGNLSAGRIYQYSAKDGKQSLVPEEGTFLISGSGRDAGSASSICIRSEEYSMQKRGLNIVVYDNKLGQVVSSSNFDLQAEGVPRTDDLLPEVYLARMEAAKLKTAVTFTEYLSQAAAIEQCTVFIAGTETGTSPFVTNEDITLLRSYGLQEAEMIIDRPYAAVLRNGTAAAEASSDDGRTVRLIDDDPVFYSITLKDGSGSVSLRDELRYVDPDTVLVMLYSESAGMIIDTKVFQ